MELLGLLQYQFEIETPDSIYLVHKKGHPWWKNFASYHVIESGESLVFNFNLDDSTCEPGKRRILRGGYQGWAGLPEKNYDSAKIRVVYELKGEITLLWPDSSEIKNERTRRSFLTKLASKQYDIKIDANRYYSGFKSIIDLDTAGSKNTSK